MLLFCTPKNLEEGKENKAWKTMKERHIVPWSPISTWYIHIVMEMVYPPKIKSLS